MGSRHLAISGRPGPCRPAPRAAGPGAAAHSVAAGDTHRERSGRLREILCSGVFVSGRAPEDVARGSAYFFVPRAERDLVKWTVDRKAKLARASIGDNTREARYYGDQGCIIQHPGRRILPEDWDRRRLLQATQALAMVVAFGIAALSLSGAVQAWHVVVSVLVTTAAASLSTPSGPMV